MHERNPYKEPPDFAALADFYPPLRSHLRQTPTGCPAIEFKDAAAQRCLTEALLQRDFGLSMNLPEGRLCPPVPNRLNYVLWIQDIMKATTRSSSAIAGIDIGTGASAIYPLLGSVIEPSWMFVGTEIDEISLQSALVNVHDNNLSARIQILKANPSDPTLFPIINHPESSYDFTMCNPPFYESVEEVRRSSDAKTFAPNAVCTGAEVEMITAGGESAFVRQMVDESVTIGSRCRWFTSMLGKLSSVSEVVGALRKHGINNYALTELVQGQTRRWAIGWSFQDQRLPDDLARCCSDALQGSLPLPNTLRQPLPAIRSVQHLQLSIQAVLAALEGIIVDVDDAADTRTSGMSYHISAFGNTWSRAARRQKKVAFNTDTTENNTGAHVADNAALECTIVITTTRSKGNTVATIDATDNEVDNGELSQSQCLWMLECTWTRGRERALFESFWSHVSRKVGATLTL